MPQIAKLRSYLLLFFRLFSFFTPSYTTYAYSITCLDMIRAKVDKRVWTEGNLDEEPGSQGQCIFLLVLSYHLDFLSCCC